MFNSIVLFTDNILRLHHNEIEHEYDAISGKNDRTAQICLVSTLNCIVTQKLSVKRAILGLQPREKAAMLVVKTKEIFPLICIKIEFISQRREMLLFLTTNMAAVMSLANQQFCAKIISTYLFLCMKCSCRIKTKISHEIKQREQTIIFCDFFFLKSA